MDVRKVGDRIRLEHIFASFALLYQQQGEELFKTLVAIVINGWKTTGIVPCNGLIVDKYEPFSKKKLPSLENKPWNFSYFKIDLKNTILKKDCFTMHQILKSFKIEFQGFQKICQIWNKTYGSWSMLRCFFLNRESSRCF